MPLSYNQEKALRRINELQGLGTTEGNDGEYLIFIWDYSVREDRKKAFQQLSNWHFYIKNMVFGDGHITLEVRP